MKNLTTSIVLSAALAFSGAAFAQSQGSIKLTAKATQVRTVTDARGHQSRKTVPAASVVPGDKVTYTITYQNIGSDKAANVVVHDPVPAHMHYIAGSAHGDATVISYSVDGGQSWASSPAKLTVTDTDGSTRAATARDVTTLRWVVDHAVAPGASGTVSFKAQLQ